MVLKQHTDDPNECWCLPAVLLTPETKTVVHRWTLRDAVRVAWYGRFGWPSGKLDPLLSSARSSALAL